MTTFKEFWPFYLQEHSNPLNRRLHFVGTFFVHVVLLYALITQQWMMLWLLPVIGYGFAWVGHFIIEKNRPATFKHPLWSLRGDFKMFYAMCAGKLWK
ncbi:Mpo1-like protein [Bdellovibrio sp. HCB-110]|uniref:Mpo1-like protein n=1 Tax=Bdellovibrio sp. HCB-110 TaxID=3391182 RepID=UPI0039B39F20